MKRLLLLGVLLLFCGILPASAFADGPKERITIVGDVLVDRGVTTKDVAVADGDVTVRGTVDGDIFVGDGDATIRGHVTGDVYTLKGTAILGRRAVVDGDVQYVDKDPQVAPGATVGGKVSKIKPNDVGTGLHIAVWVAITVSTLVLGLLLLLLFPKAADAVARTAKAKALVGALVGLLAFFLLPALGILLLITLVGLPLGVGLLLTVPPLYGLAYTASAFVIGRLVLKKSARILAFVAGLVILRVLALIPIAGGIVWFLATVLGLGVLLLSGLRARSA